MIRKVRGFQGGDQLRNPALEAPSLRNQRIDTIMIRTVIIFQRAANSRNLALEAPRPRKHRNV